MRTWEYEIDPSTRTWILWVYDDDLKTGVLNADYNHRATPGIEEYARFIVDACNAAEHLSHIQAHPEEYRATPYDLHPWGPAMKIGGEP